MPELDLGGLFAVADIQDAPFQAKYPVLVRQYAALARAADRWAQATSVADRALTESAAVADRATASTNRTTQSTMRAAAAEEKAAAAASRHSQAVSRVGQVMSVVTTDATRLQQVQLRLIAAQERYDAVLNSGGASTSRLAAAQAGLLGAQRAVMRAEEQSAGRMSTLTGSADRQTAAMERLAAAQRTEASTSREATVASSRLSGGLGGLTRTAGELGLVVGAIEGAKKAIDIVHQASDFDASMVRIQTQAGATRAEIRGFSGDVLGLAKTGQAPDDLALSLYHVYSATKALGYTGPQMLDAVTTAAEGATVSGADLEQTTNALTATMVSGLGSVNDMGKAMGALNAIVGAGDMTLSDLNEALGTGILAALKVYGVSLAQGGAALAVFGDNNIRGADAATKLRMSVQDLSKPAANADEVLGRIGLTTTSLRDDLEKGGLSLALHHLKDNLEAAGITGDQVGGFLQDAFTKKAGVGLAILLNNLDQYDEKQKQIRDGAGGFGDAWKATTETAAFQFKRLGAEAEADGIVLAQKVAPAVGHLASMLAGALTQGLDMSGHALHPFVAGWHEAAGILGPVAHGIGDVLGELGPLLPVVKFLATDVLTLWAAWRGYLIARYALNAIADGIAMVQARGAAGLASARAYGAGWQATLAGNATEAQLTSRIMQAEFAKVAVAAEEEAAIVAKAKAREAAAYLDVVAASKAATDAQVLAAEESSAAAQAAAVVAVRSAATTAAAAESAAAAVTESGSVAAFGWAKMLGPLAIVGTGIALLTGLFHSNSDAAAKDAQNVDSLTSSIEADGNAVGKSTNEWIANKLAKDGVIGQAKTLGLSVSTITQAVLGSKDALDQVREASRTAFSGGKIYAASLGQEVIKLAGALDQAKIRDKQKTASQRALDAAMNNGTGALSANAAEHRANASATATDTETTKQAETANKKYTASLRAELAAIAAVIQARLGEATTEDQFLESVRGVTQALKGHHDSLSQDTKAGLENRDAFLGAVGAALSLKDAQDKAGGSAAEHTRKLASNIASLRAAAIAAGADKGEVDKLLHSLHAVPANIRSRVTLDAGPARSTLVQLMNQINSLHPLIHVGIAGGHTLGLAGGGGLPEGVSVVGEGNGGAGTELAVKRGPNVQIIPHGPAMSFLRSTGTRIQGFASGTTPGLSNALSVAGNALTGIGLDKTSFRWERFSAQIAAAAAAIAKAAAAGATKAELTSLRGRLHRDEAKGAAIERALGHSIEGGFGKLSILLGHTLSAGAHGKMLGSVATASDVRSLLSSTEAQLRQAGLPPAFITSLRKDNTAILNAVKDRNKAAAHLTTANQALGDAQKAMHGDQRAFGGAVTGSFDITGAVDSNGRVTRGGIIAADNQAVTRARAFVAGMKKLIAMKIFPGRYLRTLLGDGPTPEALATVQALARMPRADVMQLAADNAALNKLGNQLGGLGATRLDQGKVDAAQKVVDHWERIEAKREQRVHEDLVHLGDRIEQKLEDLHLVGKLGLTKGELALVVETGKSQNAKATRSGTRTTVNH